MTNSIDQVRAATAKAAEDAGRDPALVEILPVTKYMELDRVKVLRDAGFTRMAESRPQQLAERAELMPDIDWVMIGRLQTNKAKLIAAHAAESQSVDSIKVAQALSSRLDHSLPIFLQVNASGEESKAGFSPDEIPEAIVAVRALPHLQIRGLMTMAPQADPIMAEQTFRRTRKLAERFGLKDLSMGMSGDFVSAIKEGSTIVRIGSALAK